MAENGVSDTAISPMLLSAWPRWITPRVAATPTTIATMMTWVSTAPKAVSSRAEAKCGSGVEPAAALVDHGPCW